MAGEWDSPDLAALMEVFATHYDEPRAALEPLAATLGVAECRRSRREHAVGFAAQHRPPLRPVQSAVRTVPRRNDDVFVRPLRAGRATHWDVACRGAAPQDRSSPRSLSRRSRYAGAGDRYRMGRTRGACRTPRGGGADDHAVGATARPRPIACCRLPDSPTASMFASPTTARSRGDFDAVVSVEMIEAVGTEYWSTYFRSDRRCARSRRASGHPGDHQAAPAAARRTTHLQLDQQVHLPRWPDPFHRGDRRARLGPRPACGSSNVGPSASTTRTRWRSGDNDSTRPPMTSRCSASTTCSEGCGTSTSPPARLASEAGDSTSSRLILQRGD